MRQRTGAPGGLNLIVLSGTVFHAAEDDPTSPRLCQRGAWPGRRRCAPVVSRLILSSHSSKAMQRLGQDRHTRLALAMGNVLVQWQGPQPSTSGFVPLGKAGLR